MTGIEAMFYFRVPIAAATFILIIMYSLIVSRAGISDATLLIALISVTCTLAVVSVLMFVIGVTCGYHIKMRKSAVNKNAKSSSVIQSPASEHMEDLQLKENVAYVTIRPK